MAEAGAPRRPPSAATSASRAATASSALRTASAACQAAVGAGSRATARAPVGLAALGRRDGVVDDGAQHGMAELDAAALDAHERRGLRRLERRLRQVDRARRPPPGRPATRARRPRKTSSAWRRLLRQRRELAPERALHGGAGGQRIGRRRAPGELVGRQQRRQLGQRQRVAVRRGEQPAGDRRRDARRVALVQQLLRVGRRQRPDRQRLQARGRRDRSRRRRGSPAAARRSRPAGGARRTAARRARRRRATGCRP